MSLTTTSTTVMEDSASKNISIAPTADLQGVSVDIQPINVQIVINETGVTGEIGNVPVVTQSWSSIFAWFSCTRNHGAVESTLPPAPPLNEH
jgi:hypothetical protein